MSERKWYVRCETGCLAESMTKEQIMTAIESAISTGEIGDCDTGFITRIKEQNNGAGLTFWVGTQAEYNALDPKINNCFYIITDDTTADDINKAVEDMRKAVEECGRQTAETKSTVETLQTSFAPIETKVNKMGVVLYSKDVFDGAEVGNTIDCDCSAFDLFAVLCSSEEKGNVILCTRGSAIIKGLPSSSISGSATITTADGSAAKYWRLCLAVDDTNKKATVKVAQESDTANFASTASSDLTVIKIVGIM